MSHYKPYPAYKDSGVEWIGPVPEHWDVIRLRHVAEFKNSNVDKKTYDGQETVSLCNYTDVYYNEFITGGLSFMQATASAAEIVQFSLRKGDVIITKDSEDPSDIGIPALVTEDVPGVVCGYHLTMIRGADFETARLLHRAIQSHPAQAHFFVEAPGITRYGLSQDAIGDLPLCIPPEDERPALANCLDRETSRIDALIAKKTRFIELLKEKRQALITHAVTKGLDPGVKMKDSGVEWIGRVPEHWEVKRIRFLASKIGSGKTPSGGRSTYVENGVMFLRSQNVYDEGLRLEEVAFISNATHEEMKNSAVMPNDVLLNITGASIGRVSIVPYEFPAANVNQHVCIVRCAESDIASWVHLSFCSRSIKEQIEVLQSGAGREGLNFEQVGDLVVTLPPRRDRQHVHDQLGIVLDRVNAITALTQRSIDLLKERRSAFITAAVTGQIDLRGEA